MSCWACVLYLLQRLRALVTFIAFPLFYIEIQNICILTCISHMDSRTYFDWIAWMKVVFRISYRKDCIGIYKGIYIYASHVVEYPIFHLRKIALGIVCYGGHIYFTAES